MADVKWIKIVTDVFDDEKILMIETLPEADSIIVIWFKLLCLAGKQNNSGVFLLGRMPYTDEMFATVFRRPINTVRLALRTFEDFGMIEIINDAVTIPNWEKHQSIETLDKIREQTRLRVAKHREKQKSLSGNVTVTSRNALDKSREDKKRKDKNREDELLTGIEDEDLRDHYIEYIKMRKMIKAPMTDRALSMLINKVNELEPNSIENQKKVLETAIMNNWKSVYPLRDAGKQDKQPSKQEEELLKMFGG